MGETFEEWQQGNNLFAIKQAVEEANEQILALVEGMAKQSDPENPERAIQAIADAVPLKRLADPEEVGELAAFLGCYESSYITGTQIVIDGGSTLPETTSMGQ